MVVIYPAIFFKTAEGGYMVSFPDLENGATEGKDLEEAMYMAEDFIGTWLYEDFVEGNEFPKASNIKDIKIEVSEEENLFVLDESFKTLVSLDIKKYVSECKSSVVRKNVSIPSWLNEIGKRKNLNFSNLLQEAIKRELEL